MTDARRRRTMLYRSDDTSRAPQSESSIASFARDLLEAGSFGSIAAAAQRAAQDRIPNLRLALFWSMEPALAIPLKLRCAPRFARGWTDPELAAEALRSRTRRQRGAVAGGKVLRAWPISMRGAGSVVAQVELDPDDVPLIDAGHALDEVFALLARRVSDALETRRLKSSVRQLEQAERLQRSLYAIADLASSELEM